MKGAETEIRRRKDAEFELTSQESVLEQECEMGKPEGSWKMQSCEVIDQMEKADWSTRIYSDFWLLTSDSCPLPSGLFESCNL